MGTFKNINTGEIRDLPLELVDAWIASGNPKASVWEAWEVVPPPILPEANWAQFKDVALNSSTLKSIMLQAYEVSPVAAGALAAALLRAEQGDYADFAASWNTITQAVIVSPEAIAGFVGVAQTCNLPAEFIAAFEPSGN